jgi:hypothetical protein
MAVAKLIPHPKTFAEAVAVMATTLEKEKPSAFPKTIGEALDMLYVIRDERIAAGRLVDARKALESALEAHVIGMMEEQKQDGGKGKVGSGTIQRGEEPKIVDFLALMKYAVKTGSPELIQQRAGSTAIKERWARNQELPGVEHVETKKLSLTKVSKK